MQEGPVKNTPEWLLPPPPPKNLAYGYSITSPILHHLNWSQQPLVPQNVSAAPIVLGIVTET